MNEQWIKRTLFRLLLIVQLVIFFSGSELLAQDVEPFSEYLPEEEGLVDSRSDIYSINTLKDNIDRSREQAEEEDEYIETTIFDLYLSDTLQGAIVANYTDQWFEIANPEDALDQIPQLKERKEMKKLLSGRIYKSRVVENLAEVRFELSTFQIIIDADPQILVGQELEFKDRVPDPQNKFAFQQRLQSAVSGDIEDLSSSFTHRSLASYGKFWSRVEGSLIQEEDYQLDKMSLAGIVGKFETGLGLLQTPGSLFAPSVDLAGLSLSTSEDVFLDQNLLRGSELEIFVPSRSRVEFYRGGRLLSSQILDFGLQEVDTRTFPEGSYDIEVVIIEDNGNVIRENRFFTKSGLLAVRSRPVYSLQAGYLRDKLDVFNTPVMQADLRWRATGILQLGASLYGTDELGIGSLDVLGVWRDFILNTGVSYSLENDLGYRASLFGTLFDFYFNASITETLGDGEEKLEGPEGEIPEEGLVPPDPDSALTAEESLLERFDRLSEKSSSIVASLGRKIGDWEFKVSANRSESLDSEPRHAYGPSLIWTIFSDRDGFLKFNMSYLDTELGDRFEARLNYYKHFDDWTLSSQVSERLENGAEESNVDLAMTYDKKTVTGRGTRLTVREQARRKSGEFGENYLISSLALDHANGYLGMRSDIQNQSGSSSDNTSLGVNLESAFNVTAEGISIDRPISNEAILIVELESSSTDSELEVLVNHQPMELLKPGEKAVIGLAPYRVYTVAIRPTAQADLITYDTTAEKITLFPGNIFKKKWAVNKVFIGIGRLIDTAGQPLAWKRIRGLEEYVVTEENGTFQAEMTGKETLYIEDGGSRCELQLGDMPHGEFFTRFGDVVCK